MMSLNLILCGVNMSCDDMYHDVILMMYHDVIVSCLMMLFSCHILQSHVSFSNIILNLKLLEFKKLIPVLTMLT